MYSIVVALCLLATLGNLVDASPQPVFLDDVANVSRSPQRIVSGWEAEEGQIPHQLSIRMVNTIGTVSSCGASIIHNEWGLTAAHCTALRPTIVIRAGLVHLTRPEYIFETTTWFNHPLYIDALQSVVQPHDIALLKFERFLPYTNNIKPIRLQSSADMNKQYEGERLVASGWGRTWTNGLLPEHLNWVYLLGVTNFQCSAAFGFNPIIVDSTICARGYNVSSQSTCQGDSGGPLTVIDEDGELSQVGVASFVSSSGCHTDVPAGFIRPGHYHDWITEITGLNFDVSRPDPTTESPEETTVVNTTEAPQGTSTDGSQETTTAPISTTAAPIETTSAPIETTPGGLSTTAVPISTTSAPIETSPGPISTTAAPIETTSAPIETTPGGISTTAVPISTTSAPIETSPGPISTTAAPIGTTSAPIETTPGGLSTTAAPISTTAAPIETTSAPIETTAAPIGTTSAPIETTPGGLSTTAAPISTTAAPIETTSAPIETTPGGISTTAVPISTTSAPIETSPGPIPTTAAPIETTSAPIETTPGGLSTTAVPISTTSAPIETSPGPISTTAIPEGTPTDISEEITAVPGVTPTESPEDVAQDPFGTEGFQYSEKRLDDDKSGESLWSRLNPRNLFKFMY